ncbi:polysaccharide biosynthesis protein [Vibrio gangliei]|uniref:polysaccharide biosynthesis protein n=1 Tax=Vibrio gangliei TaxID=2077090 RepID=UPI000D020629|nr:nucleoside-diphosphate sugar epimerase/dehydratase [Vibrio gangliei]
MYQTLKNLLKIRRREKRIINAIYDIAAITFSLYFAVVVRLGHYHFPIGTPEILSWVVTVIVTIAAFIKLGMYRAVIRYMMVAALGHIFLAVMLSTIALMISSFYFHSFVPRSVPLIFAGFAVVTLGGPRILIRNYYHQFYRRNKPNVFIYGAGATGRDLAFALSSGEEYNPAVLFDDDPKKIGQVIYGLRVHPSSDFDKLKSLYQPVKLLLAINNINKGERLRLVDRLSTWPIELQSVPSVEDIATGRAQIGEIKDLDVADLLGRTQVDPVPELLSQNITDQNIMVTGAGGSIGSELCRQILAQKPKCIVLFELNEYNLYKIDQELQSAKTHLKFDTKIIAALGSVQRQNHVEKLMITHKIDTVYHAAAYKHVPLVEDNIVEGIRNNVFGTLSVAETAINTGVKNFTLISTDKAVRPTNVMGASKRLAELVLQALSDRQSNTCFTMVRFGNVLGSSGSVVPLFKQQIRKGGPVTVTHPDITRFFMLIPEAAQLVIQAGAIGHNGQVFVLDMGEPVKILDLAKRMIHLMGMTEHSISDTNKRDDDKKEGDIEIRFTGLRPGEKLYEELLIGENVTGTCHPKIMTACEESLSWAEMETVLQQLDACCHDFDLECIKRILLETPTGYRVKNKNE